MRSKSDPMAGGEWFHCVQQSAASYHVSQTFHGRMPVESWAREKPDDIVPSISPIWREHGSGSGFHRCA